MEGLVADDSAVYPIGVASQLLGIHPRTLRIYEEETLIKPVRRGNKRYYSNNDLRWVRCIRELIHSDGISIAGIKRLMDLLPCWEIRNCPPERREACSAKVDARVPCWKQAQWVCPKAGPVACASCDVWQGADSVARKPRKEKKKNLQDLAKSANPPFCILNKKKKKC